MPGATISTDNYTIGSAKIFFAATIADDKLTSTSMENNAHSWGNITTTGINPDVTYVEHFVSSKGKRVKDKIAANTISLMVNFTFDEMNQDNLNYFFLGNKTASEIQVLQSALTEGCARLKVDTDVGQDLTYVIPKCVVRPDGALDLMDDDWHSAPMVLEVLEFVDGDTANGTYNATWLVSPFGRVDTANL